MRTAGELEPTVMDCAALTCTGKKLSSSPATLDRVPGAALEMGWHNFREMAWLRGTPACLYGTSP